MFMRHEGVGETGVVGLARAGGRVSSAGRQGLAQVVDEGHEAVGVAVDQAAVAGLGLGRAGIVVALRVRAVHAQAQPHRREDQEDGGDDRRNAGWNRLAAQAATGQRADDPDGQEDARGDQRELEPGGDGRRHARAE